MATLGKATHSVSLGATVTPELNVTTDIEAVGTVTAVTGTYTGNVGCVDLNASGDVGGATATITGAADLGSITQDGWTYVDSGDFLNSWVNYGNANYSDLAYKKLRSGLVVMTGLIKSGSINASAFILPVGYRPAKYKRVTTYGVVGGAGGPIELRPDGNVVVASPHANGYVYMDLVFMAEQ